MDSFTENILARARERQKLLEGYSSSDSSEMPLQEKTTVSQPNIFQLDNSADKPSRKVIGSDSNIPTKVSTFDSSIKQTVSEGNLHKLQSRQNSRTRVSSDIPGSPQSQLKTLNIQNDNFNMEIKVTSADNIRVEVEIEEQDEGNDKENETGGLREESRNRLQRLGKLYAGGDDADISSPIHRSENKFCLNDAKVEEVEKNGAKNGKKGFSRLADLAETINQWEDDVTNRNVVSKATPKRAWKQQAPQPPTTPKSSPVKPKAKAPNPPSEKALETTSTPGSPVKCHANVVAVTPKQLKWDKNVLDTLDKDLEKKTTPKPVDPALMSVSERKALFEKVKGEALVPKAAFGMAAPMKKATLSTAVKKPQAPKPPVTAAAVSQATGIASKVAALLGGKSTISQSQIESNVKEQRQKEMDMLLNRFNKNTDTQQVIEEESEEEEEFDDEDEITEETAMISEKNAKIISKPAVVGEARTSGGKRLKKTDSPRVVAVLEEVKRIRVSPPKAGKLYPNLSDIEATATETETENPSPTPNNSSFEDNVYESDDANTSFGRDILQAVCKNQTPQKRPIYDESTASDISSVLDEMDNYLDNQDSSTGGPTPPKLGRANIVTPNAPQPSNSFHYKSYTPNKKSPKPKFQSPVRIKTSPRKSSDLPNYVVEGNDVLPLTHTVSFYRKQQNQKAQTPVRQISRQPLIEESNQESLDDTESVAVRSKMKELQTEVNKQQMIISQTSQALNLCYCTPEFSGSTEQVEAEKVLLVATHRRLGALNELQRLEVEGTIRPKCERAQNFPAEKGMLTISNISLPLKHNYVKALAAAGGKGHHVVCLIKCGEQVVSTKLVSTVATSSKNPDVDLPVPGTITLNNIYSDFTVTLEVYCLQAQEEYLPHEVKYHINNKKSSNKLTPKKSKQDSRLVRPIKESPAGPQAVRSPAFAINGYVIFSVQAGNKRLWSLNNTRPISPLEGSVEMRISCDLAVSVEQRGFLTMFEDVSGFGAWHRRWCLLKGSNLSYWKYPDDERKMAPIDTLDLKNCVTKTVGLVSREICARLHTFLLERERMSYPQDKDTLVMVCKGDKTVIRHLLSADTKEERIEWCAKLNAALAALQMCGN